MPITDYTPSVQQVAANIMSRTRNQFGALVGTFDATTTPTDTQTTAVIDAVINDVADVIGDDIPEALWDDAAKVVAKKAAMQVELDFFSEQVNTGRSIYPQLKEEYDTALANLSKQVVAIEDGGEIGVEDTSASTRASFGGFPDSANWMTRNW